MIYCYKIMRDFGFAPNPFHGICTLATCKPKIRDRASVGDWVAGFGGLGTNFPGKMVFIMRVDEKLTYDDYWNDMRFSCKKARFDKSIKYCYGDNIYHHNPLDNEWMQENSHHSYESGINYINLKHDTRVNNVLVSNKYMYFGDEAIEVPEEFSVVIPRCRDYIKITDEVIIDEFLSWLYGNYNEGQQGLPFSWNKEVGFARFKGERT